MKAAVVREPFGIDHLSVEDVEDPVAADGEVVVRIVSGSLNPIDMTVTANRTVYGISPVPHIPGSEVFGTVETDGERFRKGDRVAVYPRLHDGTCEYCLSGKEYLCTGGGIFGVVSNGGFCEKVAVKEENLVKLDAGIGDELAASLTVSALTAYHALRRAHVTGGQKILIYGASGNTGIFAVQMAKSLGLEVHAVSRKSWITEYGADSVYAADSIPETLKTDVVINSLGSRFWDDSLKHLAPAGTLTTFGVLTGVDAAIKISALYTRELSIIGSTGGTRKELAEVIKLASLFHYRAPVHRSYDLDHIQDAMREFETRETGRILLKI